MTSNADYNEYVRAKWLNVQRAGSNLTILLNWCLFGLEVTLSLFYQSLPLVSLFLLHLLIHLSEVGTDGLARREQSFLVKPLVLGSFMALALVGGCVSGLVDARLPIPFFWSLGFCVVAGLGMYPQKVVAATSAATLIAAIFLSAYFLTYPGSGIPAGAMVVLYVASGAISTFSSTVYESLLWAEFTAYRRIEQTRERLHDILQTIGDGVITTDREGTIQFLNRGAEVTTGWSAEEAIGKPLVDVLPWVREAGSGSQPSELLMESRSGRRSWVSVSVRPLGGTFLSFQDITARKEAEESRLVASKMESLSRLAGGIAHDYNNFLTVIRGHATLLLDRPDLDGEVHRSMEGIESAAVEASSLANRLLTFAQGGEPVARPQTLRTLLASSLESALKGTAVTLETKLQDDLWEVKVDDRQITHAFQNLVLNAVQAMPGGGRLLVEAENVSLAEGTATLLPGRYVRLHLHDNGGGIPPHALPRIFDPYFSTEPGRSGLGLTTAYTIVARHGGGMDVQSAVGSGTTVTMYLPAAGRRQAERDQASPRGETSLRRGGRILIMDDETPLRRVLAKMLARLGFEATETSHGEEAIQVFREAHATTDPFRCVILDLTIPGGMGGERTLQELRKIDPDVVAVVASGYATENVMANHESWGFKARLPKPFGLAQLEAALEAALAD